MQVSAVSLTVLLLLWFSVVDCVSKMTTQEDNEFAQLKIEGILVTLDLDELMTFAGLVKVPEDTWKDKSQLTILYAVRKFIDSSKDQNDDPLLGKRTFLARVADVLRALSEAKKKNVQPVTEPPNPAAVVDETLVKTEDDFEGNKTNPPVHPHDLTTANLWKSLTQSGGVLRKELKFTGQIGEHDQKDKLTFVGVHNQITGAQGTGYSDKEIVSACIRAMTPQLPLRKFLEATSVDKISLVLLNKYLLAHFHEKSAQELYGELDKLTQKKGEDAMSFLFRAFELEAKICLAAKSEEEDSFASKYPSMVRGLTLNTIDSGLVQESESVRNQIRPFLLQPKITPDNLAAQMRIIMAGEKCRKGKLITESSTQKTVSSIGQSPDLWAAINSLTNKVDSLVGKKNSDEKNGGVNNVWSGCSPLQENYHPPGNNNFYGRSNGAGRGTNNVFDRSNGAGRGANNVFDQSNGAVRGAARGGARGTGRGDNGRSNGRVNDRFQGGNGFALCNACTQKGESRCSHCRRCGGENHFARHCTVPKGMGLLEGGQQT